MHVLAHTHTQSLEFSFPNQCRKNTDKFFLFFPLFLYLMYYIPTSYNGISEEIQLIKQTQPRETPDKMWW